jgi:hypothetical protein
MVRRSLLVALGALFVSAFGCSSSKSETTAAVEDTGPAELGPQCAKLAACCPTNADPAACTAATEPADETACATQFATYAKAGTCTPPEALVYPPGPYGLNRADIFPNLSFKGYKGGEGKPWTDISMIDYFDPTGEKGIYAILYVVSAEWCGPCRDEAKKLPGFLTNLYAPRGAHFMTGVIENTAKDPADQPTVDRWLKFSHLNFDAMMDPGAKAFAGTGIPRNYIINPRNMQILRIITGSNPDATNIPELDHVLDLMGAPPKPM